MEAGLAGSTSGHRVLIFAQLKGMLDLVERDLFQGAMKGSVSYLRLDGGVEPTARFDIVRQFNRDPTIDVLLLTTHVGGLGLNLTSADTVRGCPIKAKVHVFMDRLFLYEQTKKTNKWLLLCAKN